MQLKLSQTQIQKLIKSKPNKINPNEPVSTLKQFIKTRPIGTRNLQIIYFDLNNFQSILSKMSNKHFQQIVNKFTEQQCQIILDYLHRFMQYIGLEDKSSGNALNFEEEIIKKYGPGIIIQASARQDTLVNKTKSFI